MPDLGADGQPFEEGVNIKHRLKFFPPAFRVFGARLGVQHIIERLNVAPIGFIFVVLFLIRLLDLGGGCAFRQADIAPIAFVEVAVVVAERRLDHAVIDHFHGGVHPQASHALAIVEEDFVKPRVGGHQAGFSVDVIGQGVAHHGVIAEVVGK